MRYGPLPPYAGVNRIRFSGSVAAATLSSARQRSPGDGVGLGGGIGLVYRSGADASLGRIR